MNNFDSHCMSEFRTMFPELLCKSRYVLEPRCQNVLKYTVLCVSLETIIEFQITRNRHGLSGSGEENPELTPRCMSD